MHAANRASASGSVRRPWVKRTSDYAAADEEKRKRDQLEGDTAEVQMPGTEGEEQRRPEPRPRREQRAAEKEHRGNRGDAEQRRRQAHAEGAQPEQLDGQDRSVNEGRVLVARTERPDVQRPGAAVLIDAGGGKGIGVVAVAGLVAVEPGRQILQIVDAQHRREQQHAAERRPLRSLTPHVVFGTASTAECTYSWSESPQHRDAVRQWPG